MFSGLSPDGRLVEIIELADHPFFMAGQFHPELKSRPTRPHPLFRDFVGAAAVAARTERCGARRSSSRADRRRARGPAPESSELVFEGAIFTVAASSGGRAPTIPTTSCATPGPSGVLPRDTGDGDVLLVRQFRPAIRRRRCSRSPPGSSTYDGEDALSCAARELDEETGYRARSIEFLGGIYTTRRLQRRVRPPVLGPDRSEPAGAPEDGIELVRKPFDEMVDGGAGRPHPRREDGPRAAAGRGTDAAS